MNGPALQPGFGARLAAAQSRHGSLLCVGLDPEPARLPGAWRGDAARVFDFCARIVDATADLVCAYKPQIAHFAAQRAEDALERLVGHIHARAPGVPVILDAKRGDIGATAEQYAKEAFERYRADAVTLSPYMGGDSLEPWTRWPGRGLILLCRTSNAGGGELQALRVEADPVLGAPAEALYERVARRAAGAWRAGGAELGLVVGATFPDEIARVRALAPHLPLLVPGVGAQGGDAAATVRAGWRPDGPLVVNSSRAVLYAWADDPALRDDPAAALAGFDAAARRAAQATRATLQQALPVPAGRG